MSEALERIADALDRLSPIPLEKPNFDQCDVFLWQTKPMGLVPINNVSCLDINLLLGIDSLRDTLLANTLQFARGFPANNALLWGARGMGKSSLVKAVHQDIGGVILIEIQREDLSSISDLLNILRSSNKRFLLFCDDLSFDHDDTTYKSLKAVLDGGIEGRPDNVLFYATSNRRHLMPRDMIENEGQSGVNPAEAVEEKVSLSDRFGLWLGFHSCSQDVYLAIIRGYCDRYLIDINNKDLYAEAIEWQATRGSRSGRVAWQFFVDLAGRRNVSL
ncbi:ATP-binding protein [Amylibacter sp.]|nr:ATP-binding protein [Amylibacter sp.]